MIDHFEKLGTSKENSQERKVNKLKSMDVRPQDDPNKPNRTGDTVKVSKDHKFILLNHDLPFSQIITIKHCYKQGWHTLMHVNYQAFVDPPQIAGLPNLNITMMG